MSYLLSRPWECCGSQRGRVQVSSKPTREMSRNQTQLSEKIATLFDPLGFLSPYVVRAKILFQEMWASGTDWDDPVYENRLRKAHQWLNELLELPSLRIPRCFRTNIKVRSTTLHTFVDASQKVYGAVTYIDICMKMELSLAVWWPQSHELHPYKP